MAVTEDPTVDIAWDAPGEGTWSLDRAHFPRPATRLFEDLSGALSQGFGECAARYGLPIDTIRLGFVNGFMYVQQQIADPGEFQERAERAERAIAERLWLADTDRWNREVKPRAIDAHRALIAVDPDALDDAALVAHLRTGFAHYWDMWVQHHQFNLTHWIPVGDFIVFANERTGVKKAKIAQLLSGASPVSRGECAELATAADAIAASSDANAILDDAETRGAASVIDALRVSGDVDVAVAMEAWITIVGYRPIDGFDVSYPYALERPGFLVAALRGATRRSAEAADRAHRVDEELADLRAAVPERDRAEFDVRYGDARRCLHVRDERGIYSDAIAAGIMRRAMLAAGERVTARGGLPYSSLAVDATIDELCALIEGAAPPALTDDLHRRATLRASLVLRDAPPLFGPEPPAPPPAGALPPAMGRMLAAIRSTFDEDTAERPEREDGTVLVGVPASPGVHRGRARVLHSADEFHRLEDGDVLITITTGEAFNVAISLVSALVTDEGGIMSHAGITSREFGIPAVLGTRDATVTIPDGATVVVDGHAGTVTWE